ncbi:hypothetical protein LINPERHAP2_LOCUS38629 [Linum perenne]
MSWDSPLQPWITHHLKAKSTCLLFGVACWSLRKTRNEFIFTDTRTTPEALSQRIMVALNSDGSVIPETGRTAIGSLFRDANGRCLVAYSMKMGICSITRDELRATVTGLQIAWEKGKEDLIGTAFLIPSAPPRRKNLLCSCGVHTKRGRLSVLAWSSVNSTNSSAMKSDEVAAMEDGFSMFPCGGGVADCSGRRGRDRE